jgi:hypothetical protein
MTQTALSASPASPAIIDGPSASDPHMTSTERAQLIQLLKDSQQAFLKTVSGFSDAQWRWKPAPERWSVGECAEHIMLAERQLFAKAQEAMQSPPAADWEIATHGKTEALMQVMPSRDGRAQAPDIVSPRGTMERAEVMRRFAETRATTLKFVEETQLPLKAHLARYPVPLFDPLNAYQWILCIPMHDLRHVKQLSEVAADAGFPAKYPGPEPTNSEPGFSSKRLFECL